MTYEWYDTELLDGAVLRRLRVVPEGTPRATTRRETLWSTLVALGRRLTRSS